MGNIENFFFVQKTEHKIFIKIFFLKFKFKKKYSFADILYHVLTFMHFRKKDKYFICGLFDSTYKWHYEIRYHKFSFDEIFELFKTYDI